MTVEEQPLARMKPALSALGNIWSPRDSTTRNGRTGTPGRDRSLRYGANEPIVALDESQSARSNSFWIAMAAATRFSTGS